jgi:hypothetical protein
MSKGQATLIEAIAWVIAGIFVMFAIAKFAYDNSY